MIKPFGQAQKINIKQYHFTTKLNLLDILVHLNKCESEIIQNVLFMLQLCTKLHEVQLSY